MELSVGAFYSAINLHRRISARALREITRVLHPILPLDTPRVLTSDYNGIKHRPDHKVGVGLSLRGEPDSEERYKVRDIKYTFRIHFTSSALCVDVGSRVIGKVVRGARARHVVYPG